MCIIVDANKLGGFVADEPDADSVPVRRWLGDSGRLVYSDDGEFEDELGPNAKRWLQARRQAGKALRFREEELAHHVKQLETSAELRSNDSHVLALALASGARLLYTADRALMQDFKNPAVINDPRGKVYSTAANAKLLTRNACAKPRPAQPN